MTQLPENDQASLAAKPRTARQRKFEDKVERAHQTLIWNESSDDGLVLEALARRLDGFWVQDALPRQIEAIQEALTWLADGDDWDVRQRGGRLIFFIHGEETEARTGRQLKRAFARWSAQQGGYLWIGFRKVQGIRWRYYREPVMDAYQAVVADQAWITRRIPGLEPERDEQLTVPGPGDKTITELAAEIGWPGGARGLVAALPQMRSQFGWMAEPVYSPATGKPKRDSKTDRALYRVSILGPSE